MRWRATLRRRRVLAGTAAILLLAACARPTIGDIDPSSPAAPSEEPAEPNTPSTETVPATTNAPTARPSPVDPVLDERFEVAFGDPRQIADAHTCAGADVSPALHWTEIPEGTVEIAVTMEGERPMRGPARELVQWIVVGIDPSVTDVAEGAVLDGSIVLIPYSGTCGTLSREGYIFTVYFMSSPVPTGQDARDPFTLKNTFRAQSIEVRTTIGYRNIYLRPASVP